MTVSSAIAQHLRVAFTGPNAPGVNLRDTLADVTWQEATTSVHGLNPIATLVYHMQYYIRAVTPVLQGGPLDAHDKYSFEVPPIRSAADWEAFCAPLWAEAEALARLIEPLTEAQLAADFANPKYGSTYRNLHGVIEHFYYHLGQISLIKKLLRAGIGS